MGNLLMNFCKIAVPLVFSLFVFTSNTYASWYAWYDQSSFYGVWATIWTPTSTPFTPIGAGQSHSVTTLGPYWIQAGWLYYDGYSTPQKYWEYCAENCDTDSAQYRLQELGSQNWNNGVKYEISFDGSLGSKTWCAWVGVVRQVCKENIRVAPTTMVIQSEVHHNSQSQINTEYKAIRIKNSNNVWVSPTLTGNLYYDFPYKAEQLIYENFKTYRIDTEDIFLPIIIYQ